MCKDFSQIDEVPPTEFWLFCLIENKDEQLWLAVCDIIYKLNLIFYWTSAANVMVITSYWLIKSVPSPPYL